MDINETEILETMRSAGYRLTGPRRKLVDLLVQADAPLTAEEIYQLAQRARLQANLSTIYRNLATFCEMGWLEAVPGSNGERHYQLHNEDERMAVMCLDCGQLTTLNVEPGQRLSAVVRDMGFNTDSLRVTLAARCEHPCANKEAAAKSAV